MASTEAPLLQEPGNSQRDGSESAPPDKSGISSGMSQRTATPPLILPGESGDGNRLPVAVIVHLSGRRRGTTQRLTGDSLRIGAAVDAEIRVSPEPCVAPYHATLQVTGSGGFELIGAADCPMWV